MQIGATTAVETALSVYSSQQASGGLEAEQVDEVDRFEPSQPVLGAAEGLPGEGAERPGFKVDGGFGFCENCGSSHEASGLASGGSKGSEGSAKVNGVEIPDLHTLGEEESGVTTSDEIENEVAGGEAEEETEGAGENPVERDSLTGEAELTEEEKKEVEELKRRDQEVRTHEHAHVAAGGQYVRGGIQYDYQTGPDGKRYAVGGEVSIDTSPESDPEDTIRKAQTIRQAALAPAEPSGQDRRAAAAAAQMEMQARQELAQAKLEGNEGEGGEVNDVLATDAGAATHESGLENDADDLGSADGGLSSSGVNESPSHDEDSEHLSVATDGLNVTETDDEGGLAVDRPDGEGLGVEDSDDDDGLPKVSASAGSPPVTQLDYGQSREAGQLVDMVG